MNLVNDLARGAYKLSGVQWLRWQMIKAEREKLQNGFDEVERMRKALAEARFPSKALNVNDEVVRSNWQQLYRGFNEESLIKNWCEKVQPFTMVNYDSYGFMAECIMHLEQNNVSGSIVETGTWKGGSLAFMAKASQHFGNASRAIWGFDSFEGIPQPKAGFDDMVWARRDMKLTEGECLGELKPVSTLVASEEDLYSAFKAIQADTKHLHVQKGWFQDTLPKISPEEIGPIALLRLDGDLYDSTRVCLEHLEPLVVKGGFIIVDDWCLEGARRAVVDYYTDRGVAQPFYHFIDNVSRYIQK